MAVITKYVVVRNGVELEKEFLVKKEAEAYDKMLDAADSLASFIKEGELDVGIDDVTIEAIAVFLAKNGPEVVRILKGLKPIPPPASQRPVKDTPPQAAIAQKKKAPAAKAKPKGK